MFSFYRAELTSIEQLPLPKPVVRAPLTEGKKVTLIMQNIVQL